MTKEGLTMSILSQQDEQIGRSEPSNMGNREIPWRVSSPAKSLPPPRWSLEQCGVGFDGQTGCRVCVDTCPYEAIPSVAAPNILSASLLSGWLRAPRRARPTTTGRWRRTRSITSR
jgi:ferredoxin